MEAEKDYSKYSDNNYLHNPTLEPLLSKVQTILSITPRQIPAKKSQPIEEDENKPDIVSDIIGEFGPYQLLMTFFLSLFAFPCTFHIYITTFTVYTQNNWCARPTSLLDLPVENWINYSQPHGACSVRQMPENITAESILSNTAVMLDTFIPCTHWEFDKSEVGNTIISEWSLVCDRAYLTNLSDVLFLLGVGVGGVIGGLISDKLGRKRTLMGTVVIQSILAISAIAVQSYIQYAVVRLIMGLVSVSVVYSSFVLTVELVGGKWVTICGVCILFPLPLSYVIVSLVSMALPDWRDLQLALSIPGCFLLLLWFILPESPRWLLSMNKVEKAKIVMIKAAKFNKRELPADFDVLLSVHKKVDNEKSEAGIITIFSGILLKRTVCLLTSWFGMTIAYYGLLLNIGNFNLGNIHMTSIILAIVEIPAIAIAIPILLSAGRRYPIFISMLMCGLACIVTEIFSVSFTNEWLMIGSLMVGKFAIGSTNMMLPIFTAELYPTKIRNLGVGSSQTAAGLALITVPFLWDLKAINQHLPLGTIALICIVGGLVVLVLPETGQPNSAKKLKPERTLEDIASKSTPLDGHERGRN